MQESENPVRTMRTFTLVSEGLPEVQVGSDERGSHSVFTLSSIRNATSSARGQLKESRAFRAVDLSNIKVPRAKDMDQQGFDRKRVAGNRANRDV